MQWRIQLTCSGVLQVFVAAVLGPGGLTTARPKHLGGDNSIESGIVLIPKTDSKDSEIPRENDVVTTGRPQSDTLISNYSENDIFRRNQLEGHTRAQPEGGMILKGPAENVTTGQTESITMGQAQNGVPTTGQAEWKVTIPTVGTSVRNTTEGDPSSFTQDPEYETATVEDPESETSTPEESKFGVVTVEGQEYETETMKEHEYETGITEDPSVGFTKDPNSRRGVSQSTSIDQYSTRQGGHYEENSTLRNETDSGQRTDIGTWDVAVGKLGNVTREENTTLRNETDSGQKTDIGTWDVAGGVVGNETNENNVGPRNKTASGHRTDNHAWGVAAGVVGSVASVIVIVTGSCFVYLTRKQIKRVYAERVTFTLYQKPPPESATDVEIIPQSSASAESLEITFDIQSDLDIQSDVLDKLKLASGIHNGGFDVQEGTLGMQKGSLAIEQGGLGEEQDGLDIQEGVSDFKKSNLDTQQGDLDIKLDNLEMRKDGLPIQKGNKDTNEGDLNVQQDKYQKSEDGLDTREGSSGTEGVPGQLVRHVSFV